MRKSRREKKNQEKGRAEVMSGQREKKTMEKEELAKHICISLSCLAHCPC